MELKNNIIDGIKIYTDYFVNDCIKGKAVNTISTYLDNEIVLKSIELKQSSEHKGICSELYETSFTINNVLYKLEYIRQYVLESSYYSNIKNNEKITFISLDKCNF